MSGDQLDLDAIEPDRYCGRGVCAAMEGHEGTCEEASGWAIDPDEERRFAAWLALKPYLPLLRRATPTDPQRDFDMAEPS